MQSEHEIWRQFNGLHVNQGWALEILQMMQASVIDRTSHTKKDGVKDEIFSTWSWTLD